MSLNGKVLNPLISFDMIFDTEMGLIKFIRQYCVDERFNMEKINCLSDREILSLLLSRENPNPLSILPIGPMDEIDNMYDSMMHSFKEHILKLSPFTDFGYVAIIMESRGFDSTKPSILVTDEYEEKKVRSVKDFSKIPIIHTTDDISNGKSFDPYYISSYLNLQNDYLPMSCKKNMVGKNIYLANKRFNRDYLENGDIESLSLNMLVTLDIWRKDRINNE